MNQYLRRKIWTLNRSGKFRGYLRTVSGYPVTLTDCMAGQPVSLAVDGNAVQDGTPTPDNPIDVQLCGDRTVNLFDKTLLKTATSTRGAGVGSTWEYDSNKIKMSTEKIYVKPNTQYTVIVYNNDIYWRDRIIESDANDICTCNHNHYTIDETYEPQKNLKVYTFVSKENTEYIIIRFMRTDCAEISYNDVTNVKCMLIEGAYTAETMPAYEPYGYKVSGRVEGVNLFDTDKSKWQTQTYKYLKIPSNGTTTLQIKLKSGKNIPSELYMGFTDNGYPTSTGISWIISNGAYTKGGADLMYSSKPYISMYPPYLFDKLLDIFDIMLVQGSYTTETMPAYEPYREPQTFNIYTPQQLAKVGDTADTVVLDFDNKRAYINSMFIKTIYDGSENWTQTKSNAGEDKYVCVSPKISDALSSQNTYQNATAISNIFKLGPYAGASSGIECFIIYNKSIQIYHHGEPVDEFKQFLSELANSNNQLTVLCRRESSYVTDITALQDWDAMPSLWNGTAAITADTVIAPSAITAKYYASKPEEVN